MDPFPVPSELTSRFVSGLSKEELYNFLTTLVSNRQYINPYTLHQLSYEYKLPLTDNVTTFLSYLTQPEEELDMKAAQQADYEYIQRKGYISDDAFFEGVYLYGREFILEYYSDDPEVYPIIQDILDGRTNFGPDDDLDDAIFYQIAAYVSNIVYKSFLEANVTQYSPTYAYNIAVMAILGGNCIPFLDAYEHLRDPQKDKIFRWIAKAADEEFLRCAVLDNDAFLEERLDRVSLVGVFIEENRKDLLSILLLQEITSLIEDGVRHNAVIDPSMQTYLDKVKICVKEI